MAVDRHVIGRVREDEVSALASHQHIQRGSPLRITTDEAMASEPPDIAGSGDGRSCISEGRNLVAGAGRTARRALLCLIEHEVDLGQREAGEFHVEVHLHEAIQLDRQHFAIPAGILRELVVRDDIGPALGRREM
jgi:hypothetical protein